MNKKENVKNAVQQRRYLCQSLSIFFANLSKYASLSSIIFFLIRFDYMYIIERRWKHIKKRGKGVFFAKPTYIHF